MNTSFRTLRKSNSYLVEEIIKLKEQIDIQQGVIEELCVSAVKNGLSIAEEPFIPEYLCMSLVIIPDEDGTETRAYIYMEEDLRIIAVKYWVDISSAENLEENNNKWVMKVNGIPFKVEITNMLEAIHALKTFGSTKISIENYLSGKLCVS